MLRIAAKDILDTVQQQGFPGQADAVLQPPCQYTTGNG